MKKRLIYLGSFIALTLVIWNCDDTLDRSFTPANEIPAINVILQEEQAANPNDDSGLTPVFSTLVGSLVTFSSNTPDQNVAQRIWSVPQLLTATTLDFEEIEDMGPIMASFNRANNTTLDAESSGFPIILTETLNNGDINRIETQIQVRSEVRSDFLTAGVATALVPTNIRAADAETLGLAAADLLGENQVVFEWDFGAGFIETASGRTSTFESTDINQNFNVIFEAPTPIGSLGELVTLTVTRNFPLMSSATVQKPIIVVPGLTPNRGDGRDPIKLSADGTTITIGYEDGDGFTDISTISEADFDLIIVDNEITDADARSAVENITVSNVSIDPNNANNLILTLSGSVPSILMDNVSLSLTSMDLRTQSGLVVDVFAESPVFPTGENLYAAINISSFEDQTTWNGGGFFFPIADNTPELAFSMEQSFDGTTSFLFDSMGTDLTTITNNFGIGANIVDFANGLVLPTDQEAEYIFSMWVYVESASSGTSIDLFLLDFAAFTTGAQTDFLPTGEWVKISGTRNVVPGGDVRALLRVVNATDGTTGMGRIFVDQVEMRIVDDGR